MIRILFIFFIIVAARCSLAATATTQPSNFIRYVENADGSARLESAEVAYTNDKGVDVHLIGAIHLADPIYYSGLNESFTHYDALLYELVSAREGELPTSQPSGDRPLSWVGNLQRFMRDHLNLVFQLDAIDYDKKNFVHADLDIDQFMKMQADRGESMMTLMLRSALQNMSKNQNSDAAGFALLGAL